MRLLKSTALMFSMFTRIPMPKVDWNEKNMRWVMCVFPIAGAAVGLALWCWIWICGVLSIGTLLFAAGVTLIPVGITGGIHLEGLSDTADALASRASIERKREILKDPHAGAFAVISTAAYLLLYFGMSAELLRDTQTVLLLGLMHVLSRILTGLSVICMPSASNGLFDKFQSSAVKKGSAITLIIILALCMAGMLYEDLAAGGGMIAAALLSYLYLYKMSKKQFGGMNGDLAGYYLQISELFMLAALVFIRKAVLL